MPPHRSFPARGRPAALVAAAAVALGLQAAARVAAAQAEPDAEPRALDRVTVTGGRPSTLPIEIPTTLESVDRATIERSVNASDAEDALKYLPSLTVRKRYVGDHDHAVLASRASGTGNSARSLVYADGVLLSNLLGNGAAYTPRWGMVSPDEIERVDVLYGPYSAAYAGNSAGAIVDIVTRMPRAFEGHVKLLASAQPYRLYGDADTYRAGQASASLGDRRGAWAWRIDLNRLRADGQPITFANRLLSQTAAGAAAVPVTGAVAGQNPKGQDWLLFGSGGQTHTVQDHAKAKVAFDLTPTLRATYLIASWQADVDRAVNTYLRDAAGAPVYAGDVAVSGRGYTLAAADFSPSRARLGHLAQSLDVKSNTRGPWDWEATASRFDYRTDEVRSPTGTLPAAQDGGAGRIADMAGTGWRTLALKGIWRPAGTGGAHVVEAGAQHDAFRLRTRVSSTADWRGGGAGAAVSSFEGDTTLASLWAQDSWRFAPGWKSVLGLRVERWRAFNGSVGGVALGERAERHVSPKAALSFQASDAWTFRAALGRAVRMPTVAELFQGSVAAGVVVNNDPNLKPERSWSTEWTAERAFASGLLRATLFAEHTADALYSQANIAAGSTVVTVQNVDAIRTTGLEIAAQASGVGLRGLDLNASLTYADSKIVRNDRFPASVGHWQPRVPRWRATLLAAWAVDERWSASLGARYSGLQYGTLDGSDPNGAAYGGFSRYFVADLRLRHRFDRRWSAAFGIDNLNNATYWAFHPYPQRTFSAELRADL